MRAHLATQPWLLTAPAMIMLVCHSARFLNPRDFHRQTRVFFGSTRPVLPRPRRVKSTSSPAPLSLRRDPRYPVALIHGPTRSFAHACIASRGETASPQKSTMRFEDHSISILRSFIQANIDGRLAGARADGPDVRLHDMLRGGECGAVRCGDSHGH